MVSEKYYIREYKSFNKTIVTLAFLMIFLPIIVYFVRSIIPNMIRCPYYEITGDPCPFCGFTTDMRNILKGNIFAYKYNYLSVPLLIIGVLEVVVRIRLLRQYKNLNLKKIIRRDIYIHIIIFIIVIIYSISFFVFDLNRF